MSKTKEQIITERVSVYDWVRLWAMILVVVGHSAYTAIEGIYGGVSYALPANLSPVYNSFPLALCRQMSVWVYTFHMPLFFALSGAVYSLKKMGNFDSIFKSKFIRLMIPYFVYGWLFMLPVKRLGNFYDNASLLKAMRGFLSGNDSGHLWFLPALFWCILCTSAIIKILERCKIYSLAALILIGAGIHLTYLYMPSDMFALRTGLKYVLFFSLGYAFEQERRKHQRWELKKTVCLFCAVVVLEGLNLKLAILNTFFMKIVGSFMVYLLAEICDQLFVGVQYKKGWKLLNQNLFYVYLFHDPMNYVILRIFMAKNWLESGCGCVIYTLCRTVGVFLASLILGELINKIKKRVNFQKREKGEVTCRNM